jgi:uncharacterized membrane protein YphA (DoxX/SURF4 family)
MAAGITYGTGVAAPVRSFTNSPAYQAYRILQVGFVVAPIAAGIDKFFHFLVNWDGYLAPQVDRLLNGHGHEFMLAVGVIEIIAGIGVAIKPKIFAYVVSAWLLGIIVNLLMTGHYYDIALRDLGLSIGAFALGRLAMDFDTLGERGRVREAY